MKKHKETNEEIKERINKHPYRLDGDPSDNLYILKMLLGFEPLDDMDTIMKTLKEDKNRTLNN